MKILNKKAHFLYQIIQSGIEAGMSLTGIEAKTLRDDRADLSQSYVKILADGAYLVNANIPIDAKNGSPTRSRKLLLKKSELLSLATKVKQDRLILVPLSIYNKGRLFKLEVGLGKAKKQYQKRDSLKQKDIKRELEKELRGKE